MTNQTIQGLSGLVTLLAAMAFILHWVSNAKSEQLQRVDAYRSELRGVDEEVQRIDKSISKQSEALSEGAAFYEAWLPEIVKCEDSDSLISALIVDAYALNLVLVKKGVKYDESVDYRGRAGSIDRIEITVAGRYDRLVRYLDRVRVVYPFLVTEKIAFAVKDASVEMTLSIISCRLSIPDSDRPSDLPGEERRNSQWATINDGEDD